MSAFEAILCILFNHSPIFHVSCDERFGQYHPGANKRISLLAISFWKWKVYLITFNKQLKLAHTINFDTLCPMPVQNDVDYKTISYRNHLAATSASTEAAQIQYESLKERFNQNSSIKSSFDNKASAYASTYVVLLGFYAYVFNEIWKLGNKNAFYASCAALLVCSLFTATSGLYIWGFLKLKNTIRSKFSDLKLDPSPQNQAVLAYTNWYSSEKESTVHASYIRNIESNLAVSVFLGLGLWLSVFLSTSYLSTSDQTAPSESHELMIINEMGELQKQNLSALLSLIKEARNDGGFTLYAISNYTEKSPAREETINILNFFLSSEKIKKISLQSNSSIRKSMTIKLEISK